MVTLSTIRGNIETNFLDRTDLSLAVTTSINRAIEYYTKHRFFFNESTSTFVTTSGTANYTQAAASLTAVASLDLLQLSVGTNTYTIPQTTYNQESAIAVGTTLTGQPSLFSFYKQNIILYPTPNASYTCTISFISKPAALSADSDTNSFLDNAADLIEFRAAWWIYKFVIQDDAQAQNMKDGEREAFLALKSRTDNLIASGSAIPTQF